MHDLLLTLDLCLDLRLLLIVVQIVGLMPILWLLLVLIVGLGGLALVELSGCKWIGYLPDKLVLLGQTRILSRALFLYCLYGLPGNVEISIDLFFTG